MGLALEALLSKQRFMEQCPDNFLLLKLSGKFCYSYVLYLFTISL